MLSPRFEQQSFNTVSTQAVSCLRKEQCVWDGSAVQCSAVQCSAVRCGAICHFGLRRTLQQGGVDQRKKAVDDWAVRSDT